MRQALAALVVGVGICAIVAASFFLAYERAERIDSARARAAHAARLLEDHIRSSVRTADFVTAEAAILAQRQGLAALATPSTWERLNRLERGLPTRGRILVFDPQGWLVVRSSDPQTPRINAQDREFFRVIANGEAELYVGPLIRSKVNNELLFTISRRIVGPQGELLGVAVAALSADYFQHLHQTLDLGPLSTVTILGVDGHIILRYPDPEKYAHSTIAGSPMLAEGLEHPIGVLRGKSPLDGIDRLMAYRTVGEYGVIVTGTVAIADALADMPVLMAATAAILAALGSLVWLVALFAFRSLKRENDLRQGLEEAVRARTEEARIQADEARRANDSKTRFLAAASHDLRQPLQAAGMFTEVLAARTSGPTVEPVIDKLRMSLESTNALLSALLDVSTLEAGKVVPCVCAFPAMSLLTSLTDQLEPEAARRGLTLRVVPCSAQLVSDPVLLERLLRNLLHNAVRYTEQGRILLGCRHRGGELAIQVWDTGIGIPPDKLKDVFDDFTRLDMPMKQRASKGLGLGLGIVRRTAALLGHRLAVRSTPGKGSMFEILVPSL